MNTVDAASLHEDNENAQLQCVETRTIQDTKFSTFQLIHQNYVWFFTVT